ncbi:TPA: pirin family protein [Candidatus Poribacteria bacterium]|jgi:redox-sensitive bicupin YhaK (pirin superfamily)|nr:pirin family protein [Candidatus Poribacteria bacterium]
MIQFRPVSCRGVADHGWLKTRHAFSFADYHDPEWMGWRCLRVMNEDWIASGTGFPSHPHREMEIITLVLSGAVAHEDSIGNSGVITQDEVQVMSAGRGIVHSEANPYEEELHLYQIWIVPAKSGVDSRYDQKSYDPAERIGQWQLIVSEAGEGESLTIAQDVRISRRTQMGNSSIENRIRDSRGHWIQVISGSVQLDGVTLESGDGAAIDEVDSYRMDVVEETDLLLFDLP